MSEIIHTQGLWEIVPEGDVFKIITTESDQPICTVNKREDAALIVCAHLMFAALCFAAHALEQDTPNEKQHDIAKALWLLIKQANGEGKEIKYGAIA